MDVEEVGSVEVPAAVLSEMSFIPADHVRLIYRERALQILDWNTLINLRFQKNNQTEKYSMHGVLWRTMHSRLYLDCYGTASGCRGGCNTPPPSPPPKWFRNNLSKNECVLFSRFLHDSS